MLLGKEIDTLSREPASRAPLSSPVPFGDVFIRFVWQMAYCVLPLRKWERLPSPLTTLRHTLLCVAAVFRYS